MSDPNVTGMELTFTELAEQLVEKNNSLAIILFGSRATGKNREYSITRVLVHTNLRISLTKTDCRVTL